MDRAGQGYGYSGIEQLDDPEPIDPANPHAALGEAHAIVILEGRGWVVGGKGVATAVAAGQGVWWSADEVWDVGCAVGQMRYVEIECVELQPADLEEAEP